MNFKGHSSVGPLSPQSLMRFAMSAQLESLSQTGGVVGMTGRQALAKSKGISLARLSTMAAGTADKLADLAVEIEELGYADPATLTRLAEQVRLGPDHWAVAQRWWPQIREFHGLGSTARFQLPTQVVLAAEAFAAYYQHLIGSQGTYTPRRMSDRDERAAMQLIDLLSKLACGPFGVTHDALRMLAKLSPLDTGRVMAFARRGGRWSEVVRALDRASLQSKRNWKSRNELATFLAKPPPWLFRQTYWLRAIRRSRRLEFEAEEGLEGAKEWITKQMEIAMCAEQSYAGSDLPTRRYALWCAAELTLDDTRCRRVAKIAATDPGLAPILPTAEAMRTHLESVSVRNRDAFYFTPIGGWPLDGSPVEVREALDPTAVESSQWSQYRIWKWARPSTRRDAIHLLRDAVASPCAVRYRSACDALRAAGPLTRECAVTTVIDVFLAEQAATTPDPAVLQRCLRVLGQLDSAQGIDIVEHVVRTTSDHEVLFDALLSAGDLALSHPSDAVGLIAWVGDRMSKLPADERLAIGGIYAQVAFRQAPERWSVTVAPDTPAVQSMSEWGREVLADPMLPRPGTAGLS